MLRDDLRALLDLSGCEADVSAASPLQAVVEAARAMVASTDDRAWALVPLDLTPYDAVVRRGRMAPLAQLASAVGVCDLVPLATPLLQDTTLYLDRQPDRWGEHRAYVRDETSLPGLPWFGFRGLDAAVAWMLAVSRDPAVLDVPAWEPDAWERGPMSAEWVLDRLLEEDLPGLWDRRRPIGGDALPIDLADRAPGWQRRLCLGALRHVGATGRVPDLGGARGWLGPEARAFVAHLDDLARALAAPKGA